MGDIEQIVINNPSPELVEALRDNKFFNDRRREVMLRHKLPVHTVRCESCNSKLGKVVTSDLYGIDVKPLCDKCFKRKKERAVAALLIVLFAVLSTITIILK